MRLQGHGLLPPESFFYTPTIKTDVKDPEVNKKPVEMTECVLTIEHNLYRKEIMFARRPPIIILYL